MRILTIIILHVAILFGCSKKIENKEIVFKKIQTSDSNWKFYSQFDVKLYCPIGFEIKSDSFLLDRLQIYKNSRYDSSMYDFSIKITKTIKAYKIDNQSFDENFVELSKMILEQQNITKCATDKVVISGLKGYRLSAMTSLLNKMDSTFIYILNGNKFDYLIVRDGMEKYRLMGDSLICMLDLK